VAKPMPPRAASLPAAQHLVVRYAKRGKMRFASHRDVARAFERGIRRAELPIVYSAGFSPHPKISYAGGAPTGVASEAEYLTLGLTSPQAADLVRERLDAVLPDGIDVIDVTEDVQAPSGGPEASQWRVVLPGVRPEAAARAVTGFLALAQAPVERLTDKGVRRMDARAAVVELAVLDPACAAGSECATDSASAVDRRVAVTGHDDCAILRMVVLHTAPAVRPEDVLTALAAGGDIAPSSPPLTTRLAQYWPGQRQLDQGWADQGWADQGSRARLTGKTV
jgi:radical SAM-linked protein